MEARQRAAPRQAPRHYGTTNTALQVRRYKYGATSTALQVRQYKPLEGHGSTRALKAEGRERAHGSTNIRKVKRSAQRRVRRAQRRVYRTCPVVTEILVWLLSVLTLTSMCVCAFK